MLSLDVAFSEDTEMSLNDVLQDPADPLGEEAVDQIFYNDCKQLLAPVLHTLEHRELDMLTKRWGLADGVPHAHSEIARQYNVSRERVRQIVSTAERKLKYKLAQSGM
jgi:DNA-directed RNA polymerase sigma subunit (sigma70/sigma32)